MKVSYIHFFLKELEQQKKEIVKIDATCTDRAWTFKIISGIPWWSSG